MKTMEFASHVAALNGLTLDQTDYLVRKLRAAGLLPATKRGWGACEMDARGAANLLLAVMASPSHGSVCQAVEAYRSLRPMRCSLPHRAMLRPIREAADAPTLGNALETLIERAPALKRAATTLLALAYENLTPEHLNESSISLLFSLSLTISRPAPHARLVLRSPNDLGMEVTEFEHEWVMDVKLMNEGFYADQFKAQTDLRTQTTVSHRTIFRLGDLLAADVTEEQDHETARVEGEAVEEDRGHAATAADGGVRKPGSQHHRGVNIRLPQD